MPRKMRPGKARRAFGFPLESLSLHDELMISGRAFRAPNERDTKSRVRTLQDARQCWQENRELFMTMCTCYPDKTSCENHAYRFRPGGRPWPFWTFDLHLEDTPENQLAELRRRNLLTKAEMVALEKAAHPDRMGDVVGFRQGEAEEIEEE